MPVSGNKEPGVLSRQSSSVSAGIPIKKRKFLLVQPSSPPHQEILLALPEENDVKKSEDSCSDITKKEESCSDLKNKEESSADLENKEESHSDLKGKEEYSSDLKNEEGSGAEFKSKEASESDLNNEGESGTDLKNKEDSNLDLGAVNANVANNFLDMPDISRNPLIEVKKESASDPNVKLVCLNVDAAGSKLPQGITAGSVSKLESRTNLLLTEKSVSPDFSGTTTGAPAVGVKKEIHSKLVDEDCKLKLSTGSANNGLSLGPSREQLASGLGIQNTERNSAMDDKLDNSLLSLSLSKGKPIAEEKNHGATLGSDTTNYSCSNRSKWDLNTTMDDWEGSAGDAAFQGTIDASSEKTGVNISKPSSNSVVLDSVYSTKGKQVISTAGQRRIFPTSSVQQNHQSEDTTLRLTLSTSCHPSSAKVASVMEVSNSSMQNALVSAVNINSSGCGAVKSEPIDENSKNDSFLATGSPMGLLYFSSVKREPIERNNIEAARVSTNSTQKLIAQKSVKVEQAMEVCQESVKTADVISQLSVAKVVHCQESGSSSSVLPMPLTPQKHSPSRLVTSSELSSSIDVSNQYEHSVYAREAHKGNNTLVQAAADMIYKPVSVDREAKVSGYKVDACEAEVNNNFDDPEMSRSKRMNENSQDLHANREGSVSDDEKINVSDEMMEDESFGSDCESDGNQASANTQSRCIGEDDDYEDGEVREPMVHSTVEDPIPEEMDIENMDIENVELVDHDPKDSPASGLAGGSDGDQFLPIDNDSELEVHNDKTIECIKECVGTASNENNGQLTDKDGASQELLPDGVSGTLADEKLLSNPSRRKQLDRFGKKSIQEGRKKDVPCDGTTSSGHRTETTVGESTDGNAKLVNMAEKLDSSHSIVEASFNGNDAAKDSITGGNRSRIINLPRASVTSPGRTRSIPDRPLSSRSGKERYSDIEGEKFFLHRNRDEIDTDGPKRFIREKIYDLPYRNSRPYMRGRGRFSGRLETSRSEWDTEREFALESYNNDYRFSRNKRASAMTESELESNEFLITPDGSTLSTGRGRKLLNDDLPSFRHLSSRRLSPGGRDGPTTRDIRMLRRIPRNISPSRCNDENGADLVGLQHDEKLVRSLPDEIIDPAYARPQPIYDGGSGQFVRGNRNFSTVQRRGFPRVRSKSPVGSRARSPGPWSPRRRSPDGFGGLSQLTQHRSAALYGVERIRSPERSCFPEEMVTRRRGSPSFMARPSNDMRDVESGRDHGHPRPMNSSRRSPSDRVFGRSTRRLDVSDPRIGAGDDEYFGRPVQSNRFHEFHGDGTSDERRKRNERRGLVRSFGPPYIGDGDNLRFHLDEGPRPFRFCSEGDTEFGGRSMREREFDGRIKNRPIVAPRRIRNIEEQEGNYRHSGQVWHDDGFNEAPGFKRRRF